MDQAVVPALQGRRHRLCWGKAFAMAPTAVRINRWYGSRDPGESYLGKIGLHWWRPRTSQENTAVSGQHHHHPHDHTEPPADVVLRVKALESLLVEKGLIDSAAIDALIDAYETKIGPRNGANVVARAWIDAEFKKWLLQDATEAIASLGYTGRQGEHMKVVENTRQVHNLVVCTLCSCYPWPVLGLPPVWCKSASGIPLRKCATSCCRNAPPAPTAGARSSSPLW